MGPGSGTLPLEIAWLAPQWHPVDCGATPVECFVAQHGWAADIVLTVDSQYTSAAFLRRQHQPGVPVLGRWRHHRCLSLPPPPYRGFGRPAVRGRKVKLHDQRTLPRPDAEETWELAPGGRLEGRQGTDVRLHAWPTPALALDRVVAYKADGPPRSKRPLWRLCR